LKLLGSLESSHHAQNNFIVKYIEHFYHGKHLCIVIENLFLSLRDVLNKYGKDIGLNIRAVQVYARHMSLALRHLQKRGVIHADFKPDNILMTENKSHVKLCDFGTAFILHDSKVNAYNASRFYRAPEAILGLLSGVVLCVCFFSMGRFRVFMC
jgi:serine/threonine-protein kinase PRP4